MNEATAIIDKLIDHFSVISMQDLAVELGIKQSSLSSWKSRNSVNAIKKKCRELGIYDEIFTTERENPMDQFKREWDEYSENLISTPEEKKLRREKHALQIRLRNAEDDRKDAIFECYGLEALSENRSIKLKNGEVITAWIIEGYESIEDMKMFYNDVDIVSIYDSGI